MHLPERGPCILTSLADLGVNLGSTTHQPSKALSKFRNLSLSFPVSKLGVTQREDSAYNGHLHYLDCGGGLLAIDARPNSLNCARLIACHLYLNRASQTRNYTPHPTTPPAPSHTNTGLGARTPQQGAGRGSGAPESPHSARLPKGESRGWVGWVHGLWCHPAACIYRVVRRAIKTDSGSPQPTPSAPGILPAMSPSCLPPTSSPPSWMACCLAAVAVWSCAWELGHLPCALHGGWGGGKAGAAGGRDSGAPEPQESSPPGLGEAESSGRKPGVLGCQNQKGFQACRLLSRWRY